MKQNITIIGAIENSTDRFVEKEYILMIRSLRRNGGVYSNVPIILFQPTNNNISPRTLVELGKLGVEFRKNPLPLTGNNGRGFLNMPYTCNYLYQDIKTDQMVWLDCDVLIMKEPVFEPLYEYEVGIHTKMGSYLKFFNQQHMLEYNEDAYAQLYLKNMVVGETNSFNHINTWFMQASRYSNFWRDWKHSTDEFVEDVHRNGDGILMSNFVNFSGQGKDKTSLDYALSSVEEITAGLLENKYDYREPIDTSHQYIDDQTRICHYDDWEILKSICDDEQIYNDMKEITKICQ